MKRRSVFPFIGTQKAKTTNVDLYLGDDPNKNWKEFIQCNEEVVSYMYLNDRCGLEGFEKNYEKLTKGKTVTVSINAERWVDAQIVFIVSEGKNFRYLTDCKEEAIEGDLGVRKGGNMASKGRPVSTEDVEEPCLALFKKLLFDLGYEPTCFAFDDNEMSEEQQSGAPEQQETPTTESEPTGTKTEKTFGEIVDDVLNSVIVPNEVSQADRKGGAISLPEWLGQLSLDERDQYAGQLHRLVNGLTDYMQLVTKMINQLSQQKEPTEEERLQGVMDLFKCTAEEAKDILAKYQQEDELDKDTEADDDEPILPQPKPVDPEDQKTQPAEKYLKVLTDRDDVNDDDIPDKIREWAADDIAVTRTKVNEVLKAANVRYSEGGMKGQLVQFPKPKPKQKKQPKTKK